MFGSPIATCPISSALNFSPDCSVYPAARRYDEAKRNSAKREDILFLTLQMRFTFLAYHSIIIHLQNHYLLSLKFDNFVAYKKLRKKQ